jgi:hypothetical protein
MYVTKRTGKLSVYDIDYLVGTRDGVRPSANSMNWNSTRTTRQNRLCSLRTFGSSTRLEGALPTACMRPVSRYSSIYQKLLEIELPDRHQRFMLSCSPSAPGVDFAVDAMMG